ncbi:hypothetical protein J2X19_002319 [Rhodoferax ferrireducens]|uniref:DUF2523 domain-containing protein n=1 Tax=Rhodoferax ferrireducens TaxID=192843 RepID=A0ABU2C8H6_9BURK|nr:DUF2523 family protein [Rhodoferax ferrireducens]MDR7377640.1 hypothetical protein [Rhodoferax ferrireducens]
MFAFFSKLLAKITAVVQWFADLGKQVFKDLWEIATDVPCWIFDKLLDVVVSAISSLDLSGLQQYGGAWGSLPSEILNILGLLGVGQAVAIITAAITIRLILQLIPFTRLGS